MEPRDDLVEEVRVADQWRSNLQDQQRAQAPFEMRRERSHIFQHTVTLEDLDVLERHGSAHRMTSERDAVAKYGARLDDRLHHTITREHRTHRGVGRGKTLRE